MLTCKDPDVLAHLCGTAAILLFVYRDLDGQNCEHEIGRVTFANEEYFDVTWKVLSSKNGCKGMKFNDRYARKTTSVHIAGPIFKFGRLSTIAGKIFDSVEENHDLEWSSVLIIR